MRTAIEHLFLAQDVRDYVLETGWTFTDAQEAALLAHGWMAGTPLEERLALIRTVLENTSDPECKKQIAAYLAGMEQRIQKLKTNQDGSCTYVLKAEDEEDCGQPLYPGYFRDWETAVACGIQCNAPFQIERVRVATGDDKEGEDHLVECAFLDKRGLILYLLDESNWKEGEFPNIFFPLPNPFERGDIIRCITPDGLEGYGVVETWHERFLESYERASGLPQTHAEFGSDRIRVSFLGDDGSFHSEAVIPLYSERYEIDEESDNVVSCARDNLLHAVSRVYQGEGSMEELAFSAAESRGVKETRGKTRGS